MILWNFGGINSLNDLIAKIKQLINTWHYNDTNITCNICGLLCDAAERGYKNPDFISNEYAILEAFWGFCSKNKDTQHHHCIMCEDCYDKVVKFIESLGGKINREYRI